MKKEYDLSLPWNRAKNAEIFSRLDEEMYFRLNPHWIINSFSFSKKAYKVEITDHASGQSNKLHGNVILDSTGLPTITADSDYWKSITFSEKEGNLHAEVIYEDAPSEETERQLVFWLRSIKEYLRLYATNTINTRFFRMLMNRVILKMTPSQRKISLMLIRITALELLVIILILVGWVVFR